MPPRRDDSEEITGIGYRASTVPIRVEPQENSRLRFWRSLRGSAVASCESLRLPINSRAPRISRSKFQAVKLSYYPDTASLYIDFSARPSAESREASEGVVLDYAEGGNLVGIDIDNASKKLDLSEVVTSHIPCA
jgi:uncharacterized protein YuzE